MNKFKTLIMAGLALAGLALSPRTFAAFGIGDSLFIDFGPNGGDYGILMPATADSFGHYWNNATSGTNRTSTTGYAPAALSNLIDSNNTSTDIGLSFNSKWQANGGISNGFGGLANPDPDLLGDLAQANATFDYFFIDSNTQSATMTFTGLNPLLTYNFDIFGTRSNAAVRVSQYSITGGNGTFSTTLQTSGAGSGSGGYNGNNDDIASLSGIAPDALGNITLTLSSTTPGASTNFGYISAMQITAVPEPASIGTLAALGCLLLVLFRCGRSKSSPV